jgi:hypothetical protein
MNSKDRKDPVRVQAAADLSGEQVAAPGFAHAGRSGKSSKPYLDSLSGV